MRPGWRAFDKGSEAGHEGLEYAVQIQEVCTQKGAVFGRVAGRDCELRLLRQEKLHENNQGLTADDCALVCVRALGPIPTRQMDTVVLHWRRKTKG